MGLKVNTNVDTLGSVSGLATLTRPDHLPKLPNCPSGVRDDYQKDDPYLHRLKCGICNMCSHGALV